MRPADLDALFALQPELIVLGARRRRFRLPK
jgi:ABC-type enterochelin transport system substrate-binding protein